MGAVRLAHPPSSLGTVLTTTPGFAASDAVCSPDADAASEESAALDFGAEPQAIAEESLLADTASEDGLFADADDEQHAAKPYLLTHARSLDPQTRACFIHACEALRGARRSVLASLLRCLGSEPQSCYGRGIQTAARLFGMRLPVARAVWADRLRGESIAVPLGAADAPLLDDDGDAEDPVSKSMQNIVRLAISNAAEGRSWLCFERDFARYRLAGASVDLQLSGRRWAGEATAIAAMCLAEQNAAEFNEPLPGLGIPSDFAVLADPVAVGDSVMARHGDLLVVCLGIVSARTGLVCQPFHSASEMQIGGKTGAGLSDALIAAWASHPAAWSIPVLKQRLSCIGGDGGLVLGGPEARHGSSGAAEATWRRVHPTASADAPAAGAAAADPSARRASAAGSAAPGLAPLCTTWDPFHRVDIAVWRAIRQVDGVVQIFDIAKQADYLFGMSEGAHILKAVAADAGQRARPVKAPGGTRKVVYLAGVPGSLLENYALIYKGLYARVAWKQSGHSSQTLAHLLEMGTALARPRFVLTMLLTHDILRLIVRPFAKRVQAHLEPCGFIAAQEVLLSQLRAARQAVARLRCIAAVAALCRQHLGPGDLARFVCAWGVGAVGKFFPAFFRSAMEIYGPARSFRSVHLEVVDGHNMSQEMFLGAHCQCASVVAVWSADWERISRGKRPRMEAGGRRARTRVCGQRIAVPTWVAAGSTAAQPSAAPLWDIEPRCQLRPTGLAHPPNRDVRGMFRNRLPGRCKVSRQDFLLDIEGQTAMRNAEVLLERLSEELGSILTGVGVNDSMSHLVAAAAACWDWPRLVFEPPAVADVRAFLALAAALRPCLEQTAFPVGIAGFESVPHRWPTADELGVQYSMLCSRVRRARAAARDGNPSVPQTVRDCAAKWVQAGALEVRVLRAAGTLRLSLGRVWRKTWGSEAAARVIDCASQFLVGDGHVLHRVEASTLTPPFRKRRSEGFLLPGSLARVNAGVASPVAGCLVLVARRLRSLSVTSVSATLDVHSWFAVRPGSTGRDCWAAARLHHRCRLLMSPDAACEGVGSFMRLLWNSRRVSGEVAGRVADSVALAAANVRCVGSARDEALVAGVVAAFRTTSTYRPRTFRAGSAYADDLADRAHSAALGDFKLGTPAALHGITAAALRRQALRQRDRDRGMVAMPAAIAAGLRSSADASGRTQPLPLTVRHLHARQRGATGSVLKSHQTEWIEAKGQASWRAERDKLLKADDPGSASESCEQERAEPKGMPRKRRRS